MHVHRLLLVLCAFGVAGCLPEASLHPFVPSESAIEAPEVVGVWADSTSVIRIVRDGTSAHPLYRVSGLESDADTTRYLFRFARFAGRLFADVEIDVRSLPGGSREPWLWPMHTVFRVDARGDALRLAFLDDDWVKRAARERRLKVRHEESGGEILLTEGTDGLQRLLHRIANDPAAFDTTARFARRLPE